MSARVLAAAALMATLNNEIAGLRNAVVLWERELDLPAAVRALRGVTAHELALANERELEVGIMLLKLDAAIEGKERGESYYMSDRFGRVNANEGLDFGAAQSAFYSASLAWS